ncbi:arylsulfatase [Paenibacillus sp. J5C_2022]|uniref:arylsulfatase n=1 Tax=Paenibacillus sp. J5C2022 TaxID=2977129 RepID=UPI0021CF1585|nr:arylsulfatase [Paenibacillus sp. J5C2022]MCU6710192.1 arylsulfatase [Paenibacillus sp. J5C2022]
MKNVKRPNIILIMADDMGFSDIGCYGGEIATPNLDKLAERGVRFAQMYNTARCCPSRASLLTGLYPHQAGVGYMVDDMGTPAYQGYLRDDCVTIAEALKDSGYQTGMSGKWHVGGNYAIDEKERWQPGSEGKPIPVQRGFDRFYGTLAGAGSYFHPHTLMEGDQLIDRTPGDDYYYTDAISDYALSCIEDFANESDPFFLYVAYTAPHWPLHAVQEDIDKYSGKYMTGWDRLREGRYNRLVDSGMISDQWSLSPRDAQAPSWEQVPNKEWEDARMAVYAAQVDRMDQGIGRMMGKLSECGIEEDTLILFLSDNGGCAELLEENGWIENSVYPARDGSKVVPGNDPSRMPGAEDTYMSYDLPWANASNTPFRFYKHWVHEGGISTPFIAHWPQGIERITDPVQQPLHIADIMATCLDIAGAAYPAERQGNSVTPLEGESFKNLLHGQAWDRERLIYWEHEGNCAVRDGKWKLVKKFRGDWELYNMEEDRTELHDVAGQYPEKVQYLHAAYVAWAERCDVVERSQLLAMKSRV